MKIKLYRIKKEKYDDLLQLVVNNFNQSGNLVFDVEIVQSYSEPIIIEGENIEVDIDIDKYAKMASESEFGYTKFAKIGMCLHKDFNSEKLNIPRNIFYEKEFKALGANVYVTTVDGSYGIKGFVTDALKDIDYSYFFSCGPEPMLKALYKASSTSGQMSFEERMGCGFGACMGCSCKTITGYKRICKDGPVLLKEEILWEA